PTRPIPRSSRRERRGLRWNPRSSSRGRRAASAVPPGLVAERRRGADDAGGARQLAGKNPAALDRRLEGAPLHFRAQRREETVARERDAAEDDKGVGIEDVDEVRDPGAEELGGVAH